MPSGHDIENRKWIRMLSIRSQAVREFLAEILGTFVLVCFAVGAGCQLKLGGPGANQVTAHLAGGMGVMLAITVSGGVSGGGVNPAVSLAFCLTNRTPWILYPVHVVGQLIGSFVASGLMFCVYQDALDDFDKGVRQVRGDNETASMFTSFPQDYLSTGGGFLDQVVGTGMLILGIQAILDRYNLDAPKGIKPLLVGLVVFAIGGTMGLNCGYPINPARDVGPRLFLLVAGWGNEVFSFDAYGWFWIPIVGPLTGSLAGTLIYYAFVGWHWTQQQRDLDRDSRNHLDINCSNGVDQGSYGKGVPNLAFIPTDAVDGPGDSVLDLYQDLMWRSQSSCPNNIPSRP